MTSLENDQRSELSPEASIFSRLNRTEIYQLARRAGIAVSPRQTTPQLVAALLSTSNEVIPNPYDDLRAAVFAFVEENWVKVKSQLACPAKAKHPKACYGCVDAKAVHCVVGSPNMERYLIRVRANKKEIPMPAPTALTQYTKENAPRSLEGLNDLTSFNLKQLFRSIDPKNEAGYAAFLGLPRAKQVQSILTLLTNLDAASGGKKGKAAPATAPAKAAKAPPPPPADEDEDEDEDEEGEEEDEGEDEEPETESDEGEDEEEEEEEEPAPAKAAPKVRLASGIAASTAGTAGAAAAARAAAQARAAVAPAPAPKAVGRPRVGKPAAAAPAKEAPAAEESAALNLVLEAVTSLTEQLAKLANLPVGMSSLIALTLITGAKVHKTDQDSLMGMLGDEDTFTRVDQLMTPTDASEPLEEPQAEEEEEEEEEPAPVPAPAPKGKGKGKGAGGKA
jgi:hypothetical protein